MQLQTRNLYILATMSILAVSFQLEIKPAQARKITLDEFISACQAKGGGTYASRTKVDCQNPDTGDPIFVFGIRAFYTVGEKDTNNVNDEQHNTQGRDPFVGTFRSVTPISDFLNGQSSNLNLSLDVNTSKIELTGPEIWGEQTLSPNLIDGNISVERNLNSGSFTIKGYSIRFDSFPINGMPSGINTITPNRSQFDFNLSTGKIDVYSEEEITNDLYPEANPILVFSYTQGQIVSDYEIQFTSNNDPMIVPGVTGQPPSYPLGMAYIGTIASFNSNTGLLIFRDNLGNGLTPDVSIVSSPNDTYYSSPTNSETLVGASFSVEPLRFLGVDTNDSDLRYLFSDARFSLFNSNGIFASGVLRNISIETYSFGFTGDVFLDKDTNFLSSPFIDRWRSNPTIQLLGPLATNLLLASTDDFIMDGTSGIDFTNLEPKVPEPSSTLSLLALGTLGAASTFKRKLKPSKSAEKETTKVG
ncbi:hypothetical protein MiTe_04211 [Microcystis aeruginosa NIES-2520]|uniref:Ice-binding protein C-terminal domain-containing protein n=1 Tax=Microcystis aeruginosa NIES-2520 TaxID=2303982 RepID=A0A5A5RW73_MICAE|nr:hypothetical protein MiTe_04211 [Microcystis aeruginosa NIES-2520]